MPDWKGPERLAQEHADWLDEEAIAADEAAGGPWERAFAVAPEYGARWPDRPGLDRRLHDVDGDEDRPPRRSRASE